MNNKSRNVQKDIFVGTDDVFRSPTTRDLSGLVVNNEYIIDRFIGEGKNGKVYKAISKSDPKDSSIPLERNMPLAIKLSNDGSMLMKEAKAAIKIKTHIFNNTEMGSKLRMQTPLIHSSGHINFLKERNFYRKSYFKRIYGISVDGCSSENKEEFNSLMVMTRYGDDLE